MTEVLPMYFFSTPFANPLWTKEDLIDRFHGYLSRFNERLVNARFGNRTMGLPPYDGYLDGMARAEGSLKCDSPLNVPATLAQAVQCLSPEVIYGVMPSLLNSLVRVFEMNPSQPHLVDATKLQGLFTVMVYPIYELLVEPMFTVIEKTLNGIIVNETKRKYPTIFSLMALAIVFEIIAVFQIIGMDTHMRRVLKMLLHCPASVVLSSPKLMSLLGGDFSTRQREDSSKHRRFFRQVVLQIPDAILMVDATEMVISSQNNASDRLFGNNMIGRKVADFLQSDQWTGAVNSLLAVRTQAKSVSETLVYQKDDGTLLNLETTAHPMQENVVYVFRDVTAMVRYNSLIALERAKSDQLLKSILPPSLVPRVQAGEKNICFSVASATIVFMDIVSFTPWCGSSTAETVMATLNDLFRRFDSNCVAYKTMTRIKCIGDCYVAAGGIFCEPNQPTEHARQVVEFGLDCVQSVEELNQERGQKLQIRVGINTGGPIVAGVLGGGCAKPTFEILGPSINMAQQMEHHGVPMQVQISRSVYELIYGDYFIVKERGTVDVKGNSVVTYLVTSRIARPRSQSGEGW
jgi:class 3 adenylate cyclase